MGGVVGGSGVVWRGGQAFIPLGLLCGRQARQKFMFKLLLHLHVVSAETQQLFICLYGGRYDEQDQYGYQSAKQTA